VVDLSARMTRPARLVAVDMDGTFLDAESAYDRVRFGRFNQRLQAAGARFVVASGNQYWQLLTYFDGFPDVFYIAENGALVATAERVLRVAPFEPSAVAAALDFVDRLPGVSTLACGVKAAYARYDTDPGVLEMMRRYYVRLELVDGWAEVDDDVVKLALACPAERTGALLAELAIGLPRGVVPTSSGHGSIDLVSHGVNKGVALAWLGERLGIAAEEMIAFGDGGNDVEMLALVGLGVAMANAPDDVKKHADVVAGAHDDSGVLEFLEHLPGQPWSNRS